MLLLSVGGGGGGGAALLLLRRRLRVDHLVLLHRVVRGPDGGDVEGRAGQHLIHDEADGGGESLEQGCMGLLKTFQITLTHLLS